MKAAGGATAERTLSLAFIRRGEEPQHHNAGVPEYRAGAVFLLSSVGE